MKQYQDLTEAQRLLFNDIERTFVGHRRIPIKSVVTVLGTLINKWKNLKVK
jgi:hypothetical protein